MSKKMAIISGEHNLMISNATEIGIKVENTENTMVRDFYIVNVSTAGFRIIHRIIALTKSRFLRWLFYPKQYRKGTQAVLIQNVSLKESNERGVS